KWLEPRVLPHVNAVTAVSDETLTTLRERRLLRNGLPVETIPIGADAKDHRVAAHIGKAWLKKQPGEFAFVYLGTITDRMLPVVRTLFVSLRQVTERRPEANVRLHLIGTSAQPDGH